MRRTHSEAMVMMLGNERSKVSDGEV